MCQVFSSVLTNMHAISITHIRHQSSNETMQEYLQRFTDLVIQATGTDPTTVTYHGTFILFIQHTFNKEIKNKAAGAKTIQHTNTE